MRDLRWAKPVPHCGSQSFPALPWSFVSKITNSKHPAKRTAGRQITNKSQITNSKPVQRAAQMLALRVVICLPC